MRILIDETFDVFQLFVHDADRPSWIDERDLAKALTEILQNHSIDTPIVLCSDESGLDRLVLSIINGAGTRVSFSDRMYSVAEVRAALPADVVAILDEIQKQGWKACGPSELMRQGLLKPTAKKTSKKARVR